MKSKKFSYLTAVLAVLVLMVVSACDRYPPAPTAVKIDVVQVDTAPVREANWQRSFTAFGQVKPAEEYEIGVDISAIVRKVLFEEGQSIKAGDTLLVLDDKKLKLQVDVAEAGLAEAKAQLNQMKTTHTRNNTVYKKGAISEQAYLQSEANLKSAIANVQQAVAGLSIARQDFSHSRVVSPVAGVVKSRTVEAGKNANPSSRLGVIRTDDLLRVETFVSQKDINLIRSGLPCRVYASGANGAGYAGRVESVAGAAEQSTGSYKVKVAVNSSDGLLRDGMAAKVHFSGITQSGVLQVPRAAVVDRNRELIVFVVVDSVAHKVVPELGAANTSHYPVLSGLADGDEVIVSNLRLIAEGQRVSNLPPALVVR